MREKKGIEREAEDPPAETRGRGTFERDRPPIVGTVGRESAEIRLRVTLDTTKDTLHDHIERFTQDDTHSYTDDYGSYHGLDRAHTTVEHDAYEWARDDTGDGQRKAHTNTIEGLWAGLRTFLRPFRGVSKLFLSGYVAIYECHVNLKSISVDFIAQLVGPHSIPT
jgi:transposase-like protein